MTEESTCFNGRQCEKWTEITLLPEWEEEYYLVYTAKKHGKWVMLKTLKPEYAREPAFCDMIEKEFEVRYNLAHPNIVMINDFEDVPGLGRCIITDDVYGDSLRKLIDENRITPQILAKLQHELVDAIDYIQTNHIVHHPIRPETIVFTENIGNLKLIDVGYDQAKNLEPADADTDIQCFRKCWTMFRPNCPHCAKLPHAAATRIRVTDILMCRNCTLHWKGVIRTSCTYCL